MSFSANMASPCGFDAAAQRYTYDRAIASYRKTMNGVMRNRRDDHGLEDVNNSHSHTNDP